MKSVLFLDAESRHHCDISQSDAVNCALNLLATLKAVRKVSNRVSLNTVCLLANCHISNNFTLRETLYGTAYREEWDFIKDLVSRSPISSGFEDLASEIRVLEFRTSPGNIRSEALGWAVLAGSGIVSFNGHLDWSKAWIDASMDKLEDDGQITSQPCRIRNTSQVPHVEEHSEWIRQLGLVSLPSANQLWEERTTRFPYLRFLERVKKDFDTLGATGAPYERMFEAIKTLNEDCKNWSPSVTNPSFSSKATPESASRKSLCDVYDEVTGQKELFDHHTRFTGGYAGRVHFRVDRPNKLIVVAYVGSKLERPISEWEPQK